jgi:uracil-DNA glycosylase
MTQDWKNLLSEEFEKEYFLKLVSFIKSERKIKEIFPSPDKIFKAFETSYIDTKTVIISQDPYFNGQADGLAFSVKENTTIPPSLRQILLGIEDSCHNGLNLDYKSDLTYLANQGVLLLNRILTVEKGKPLSHKNIGWELFTNKVIELLNLHPYNIIYILAGKEAQSITPMIDHRHIIIELEHPAYACRQNRNWNFDDCFNKVNVLLNNQGRNPINW